jgi:hypothetical protein
MPDLSCVASTLRLLSVAGSPRETSTLLLEIPRKTEFLCVAEMRSMLEPLCWVRFTFLDAEARRSLMSHPYSRGRIYTACADAAILLFFVAKRRRMKHSLAHSCSFVNNLCHA